MPNARLSLAVFKSILDNVSDQVEHQEVLRMALAMQTTLLQHKTEPLEQVPRPLQQKTILEEPSEQESSDSQEVFSHIADHHLSTLESKGLKNSKLKAYRSILRIHLLPQFGQTPISQINTRNVDKRFSKLKGVNNKFLSGKRDTTSSISWRSPCPIFDLAE